jgi:predicted enzyme related to lactoylglutathione lyase
VKFASVRIITNDLDRLVGFYEQITGVSAERLAPVFAEIVMRGATLAIGHSDTVPLFGEGSAHAADNHTVIIEFQVDDVEAEFARLRDFVEDWVQEPTTLPWGIARSSFETPTAIWSTCIRLSRRKRSHASAADSPQRLSSSCGWGHRT